MTAPGGVTVESGASRFVARLQLAFLLRSLPARTRLPPTNSESPAITVVRVDWRAALDQLRAEIGAQPVGRPGVYLRQTSPPCSRPIRARLPAFVQLNATTSQLFTGIDRSTVPVLLPFDTAAYLEARWAGTPETLTLSRFQADFRPVDMFDAGPAGYDAVFSLEPGAGDDMPQRIFAKPVEVQITGSLLTYDLNDPLGGKGEPVKSLAAQYPDLRRFIREGYVRYAFTRFGVPYVVSIQCLDSVAKAEASGLPRGLSGRRTVPEGAARRGRPAVASAHGYRSGNRRAALHRRRRISPTGRPATSSPTAHRADSRADASIIPPTRKFVFRWRRRPLSPIPNRSNPAGATGSTSSPGGPTSYPWQDNFCEARSFGVGQCPTGFGHQGQDMRPARCPAS